MGLEQNPQPSAVRGTGGGAPSRWAIFAIFSIKITHFNAYFGHNSYFKAIIHQIKGFKISQNVLNRINEVQIL